MRNSTTLPKANTLIVYLERRKSKELVGRLEKKAQNGKAVYQFTYDDQYLQRKNAIPLGPEFPLTKKVFTSRKLFLSFEDRIPSKANPAYKEYCQSAGISAEETNEIVLLATIGRRGPSSFIFEKPRTEEIGNKDIIKFRTDLGLTVREFSAAFDVSTSSVQKLERTKPGQSEVFKRINIYIKFPIVALYEVEKNRAALHSKTFQRIIKILKEREG